MIVMMTTRKRNPPRPPGVRGGFFGAHPAIPHPTTPGACRCGLPLPRPGRADNWRHRPTGDPPEGVDYQMRAAGDRAEAA